MSCSLHDVIALEVRGTPALAIGTEPFVAEAREQAEALGMPDYQMLTVPHPIQPLPVEQVVALAGGVLDAVVARLVSPVLPA